MKIVVVGTGYVGLVTGTCLAEIGNHVTCVDIDAAKVKALRAGQVPIYEPGLDTLVERNTREHRLHFTTNLAEAVPAAEVIFLALPTPPQADGTADLSFVLKTAETLAGLITHYTVIVNKSTVPVGTLERVKSILAAAKVKVDAVSNPEFLREGLAVDDCMHPSRLIIGSSSDRANAVMTELYAPFTRQGAPIFFMDGASAEMTKYAANAFLATKISFMNEMANLSERVGANIDAIRLGLGADDRIGKRFLYAGVGYGGSCFPKDVQALYRTAQAHHYDFRLLEAVNQVNEHQRLRLVDKVAEHFGADLTGKELAIWGLAFKPDTDDIREAPSLYIMKALLKAGAQLTAFDPVAMPNIKKVIGESITLAKTPYEAAQGADALLIITEWGEFKEPDFAALAEALRQPVIFDGRNLYDLDHMREQKFYYSSIGRPVIDGRQGSHHGQ
jgi:UDPglucose 6-dehydrogenase